MKNLHFHVRDFVEEFMGNLFGRVLAHMNNSIRHRNLLLTMFRKIAQPERECKR